MSDVSEWTIRVTICWEWWIWFQTSFRTDRCYNRYNTITLIRSIAFYNITKVISSLLIQIYTVVQKPPTLFIWLQFLQMLTDFCNILAQCTKLICNITVIDNPAHLRTAAILPYETSQVHNDDFSLINQSYTLQLHSLKQHPVYLHRQFEFKFRMSFFSFTQAWSLFRHSSVNEIINLYFRHAAHKRI